MLWLKRSIFSKTAVITSGCFLANLLSELLKAWLKLMVVIHFSLKKFLMSSGDFNEMVFPSLYSFKASSDASKISCSFFFLNIAHSSSISSSER